LVLAVLFRQLDVARKFGTPESWIQGHALWHLLTALALGSMYLYYRSERCGWKSARQASVGFP
jgi:hypothetical protein